MPDNSGTRHVTISTTAQPTGESFYRTAHGSQDTPRTLNTLVVTPSSRHTQASTVTANSAQGLLYLASTTSLKNWKHRSFAALSNIKKDVSYEQRRAGTPDEISVPLTVHPFRRRNANHLALLYGPLPLTGKEGLHAPAEQVVNNRNVYCRDLSGAILRGQSGNGRGRAANLESSARGPTYMEDWREVSPGPYVETVGARGFSSENPALRSFRGVGVVSRSPVHRGGGMRRQAPRPDSTGKYGTGEVRSAEREFSFGRDISFGEAAIGPENWNFCRRCLRQIQLVHGGLSGLRERCLCGEGPARSRFGDDGGGAEGSIAAGLRRERALQSSRGRHGGGEEGR